MQRRSTFILISILALAAISMPISVGSGKSKNLKTAKKQIPQEKRVKEDPPGTIQGKDNPALIPDNVAYSMLFRIISGPRSDDDKKRIRAYIRQTMAGSQNCDDCPAFDNSDVDALLAVGDEFYQKVNVLDRQAKQIKDRNWPNPGSQVMVQLAQLQQQKETIVTELIQSLPDRLSVQGLRNLRQHISERMKRRMKMTPNTSVPPGGPGWLPGSPSKHH